MVWFYDGMEVFCQVFIPLLGKISGYLSQEVRFGTHFPQSLEDFEVELGEKLCPSGLLVVEQFGNREIHWNCVTPLRCGVTTEATLQ